MLIIVQKLGWTHYIVIYARVLLRTKYNVVRGWCREAWTAQQDGASKHLSEPNIVMFSKLETLFSTAATYRL